MIRLLFCCILIASCHAKKQTPHSYLENYQYKEQVAIQAAYTDMCDVAFIGDSHIYKCHWDELLELSVCNRGIGSDIVEGMYRRIGAIVKGHPKYCFILGGTNDIEFDIPIEKIIYFYKGIVDTLKSHNITPVAMLVPAVGEHYPNYSRILSLSEKLNESIKKLGIKTISINVEQADLQQDQIHLSASGYLKWKKEILEILETAKHQLTRL